MKIKKLIITVFIILSVNFTYQPITFYIRERQSVVHTVNTQRNKITGDFIDMNETRRFYMLVSLTFQAAVYESGDAVFNTS